MRKFLLALLSVSAAAQSPQDWLLPNFAERLELDAVNRSAEHASTLAVIPVPEASQVALRFPGSLSIVVNPEDRAILPSQVDDVDGNGTPDEFVFPVELGPGETKRFHIYYSTTLRDHLPWPKQVHASHAFGYNRATVALESESIGYRTYGGLFLDIQARLKDRPGLYNSLVGYFGSGRPSAAGLDIIHLGDTLGLGGLFLRAGDDVHRPPLNMPDYAHKPPVPEAPEYRVIAAGPLRAVVEAQMNRWRIGADEVAVKAIYSIAAGKSHVDCRFEIVPLRLSRTYEAGAGIRHLPSMKLDSTKGRISLMGTQSPKTGPLGMALYYNPAEADTAAPLATKEDRNEIIVFREKLEPGRAMKGRYSVAAAWSGSGIDDLLGHLAGIEAQARASVRLENFRVSRTPRPERLEGEAY
ncbi:MAG TPA: DUF4861 family protein [Bryobacteraceae bacterium]|nr:DUF4861 family protein [Bryobacteraceae bacterium]